ncbi:FG-GAP-like repeat-containing protein [Streptomyces sp. NPDC001404]|uniref:FG-GAP-like repeat-containing protein n=1 Tax=Streptomyces sp. NPDC001404 TaxID=3364571 RepID=UPI0036A6757F
MSGTTYKVVFSAVDGAGPDAKPLPPEPRKLPPPQNSSGAPKLTGGETPEDVEWRRQRAEARTKGRSLTSTSRGPDYCHNSLRGSETEIHKALDHWTYCDIQRYTAEYKECDAQTKECTTIGKVNFRGTLIGNGQQGRSEDDRQLHFTALLDDPREYNADARLMSKRLTLGMECNILTASGVSPCPKGDKSGRSDTIGAWIQNGYAWWDFKFPPTGLTDRDKLTHIDFRLTGSPGADPASEGSWASKAGGARCDSAPYILEPVAIKTYGCVFDQVVSVFTFKSRPEVAQTAKHIWEAQHYPDLTLPPAQSKNIPGSIESSRPLTRMYGPDENGYNRRKSVAACKKWFGKNYSSQNGGQDCDEYPFASTYDGSWTGNANRDAIDHFSVRALPSTDNQQGGRDLEEWYREQRILDHDQFFVKVVNADGSDMKLPAPPEPPRQVPNRMGDMNGDGVPDFIGVDTEGRLRFYPARSDGNVTEMKQIGNSGWRGTAITHGGDFNGDGKQDVVARVGNELRLYPGNGDGSIGDPIVFQGHGTGWDMSISKIITVEDATGDDYPDVIMNLGEKLYLFPGDPDHQPGFKDPIQIGGGGWAKYDLLSLDDLNGDGRSDLGARNRDDGMSYFYAGPLNHDLAERTAMIRPQSGNRATTRLYDGVNTPFITSAHDLDGNGRMDLWGIRGNKLFRFWDDPTVDRNPAGDFPFISRSQEINDNGWDALIALG